MSLNQGNISVYDRHSDVLFFQRFSPHVTIIERTNFPLWAIIGIPGGLFSIVLWSSRPMRRGGSAAAAVYQACLGVVDVSFFFIYLLWYLHVAWQLPVLDHPGVCEVFPVFNYLIQYLSPTLTVTFTLERFLAICYPFRSQYSFIRSSARDAIKLVAILTLLCLMTASVQGVIYTYDNQFCNTREQINDDKHIARTLYTYWTFLTEVFYFFFLPITCLILNLFVIRVLRGTMQTKHHTLFSLSRQNSTIEHAPINPNATDPTNDNSNNMSKGVRSSTLTLLCTSFYVIVAHLSVAMALLIHTLLPTGDVTLSDAEIDQDPAWRRYFLFFTIRILIESFAMTHYAAKFPIYLLTSTQFRSEFFKLLGWRVGVGGNRTSFLTASDLMLNESHRRLSRRLTKNEHDNNNPVGLNGNGRTELLPPGQMDSRGSAQHGGSRCQTIPIPRRRPSPGLGRSVIGENGKRISAIGPMGYLLPD